MVKTECSVVRILLVPCIVMVIVSRICATLSVHQFIMFFLIHAPPKISLYHVADFEHH